MKTAEKAKTRDKDCSKCNLRNLCQHDMLEDSTYEYIGCEGEIDSDIPGVPFSLLLTQAAGLFGIIRQEVTI